MIRWLYVSLECKEKIINEVRAREKFQLKWEKSYKIFIRDRFDNLIGTIVYTFLEPRTKIFFVSPFFFFFISTSETNVQISLLRRDKRVNLKKWKKGRKFHREFRAVSLRRWSKCSQRGKTKVYSQGKLAAFSTAREIKEPRETVIIVQTSYRL